MNLQQSFNRSAFSSWINSQSGRVFRVVAGCGFLAIGLIYREHWWGIAALFWSVLPLTAGSGDLCYISKALGGPLLGREIRKRQEISARG